MKEIEFDEWFRSLPIKRKEHIATKVCISDKLDKSLGVYPGCSNIWKNLSVDRKKKIYDHCTVDHGDVQQDWSEGDTFSY